jgi:hypothetical protein
MLKTGVPLQGHVKRREWIAGGRLGNLVANKF